uniref:Uncharacterized protein n=1 Tax=Glossina austeni TaxID=7395 RepID=A0A1A9UZ78_GLOAU
MIFSIGQVLTCRLNQKVPQYRPLRYQQFFRCLPVLTTFNHDCMTSSVDGNYAPSFTTFAVLGKSLVGTIEASNLNDFIIGHHISYNWIHKSNDNDNTVSSTVKTSNGNNIKIVNAYSGVANPILVKLILIKLYGNNKIISMIKCKRSFSLMDEALTSGLKSAGKANLL